MCERDQGSTWPWVLHVARVLPGLVFMRSGFFMWSGFYLAWCSCGQGSTWPGCSCGCGSTGWFYLVVLHVVRVLPALVVHVGRGSTWFFMWSVLPGLGFFMPRRGHYYVSIMTWVYALIVHHKICQWSFKPERLRRSCPSYPRHDRWLASPVDCICWTPVLGCKSFLG